MDEVIKCLEHWLGFPTLPPEALSEWAHLCARALRLSQALPSDAHYCRRLATITARLSRLCLKAPLPRGLQPTAANTREERLASPSHWLTRQVLQPKSGTPNTPTMFTYTRTSIRAWFNSSL